MTFKVTVKGGPETAQALRELGRATSAEKVMRQALRQGGNAIRNEMRALIPVESGQHRRDIAIGIKGAGRYVANLVVGFRHPSAPTSHLIEFGTRHSAAQPFARPAYASQATRVVQLFGTDIWPRIAREATRLAARTRRR